MKQKMAKFTANLYAGAGRQLYDRVSESELGMTVNKAEAFLKSKYAAKSVIPLMVKLNFLKQEDDVLTKGDGEVTPKEITNKLFTEYRNTAPLTGGGGSNKKGTKTKAKSKAKAKPKKATPKKAVKKTTKKKVVKKPVKKVAKKAAKKVAKKAAHSPTMSPKAPVKTAITRGTTQETYTNAIEKMRSYCATPRIMSVSELTKKFGVSSHVGSALMSMHVLTRPNGQSGKLTWNSDDESEHIAIRVMNWISKNIYKNANRKSKGTKTSLKKPMLSSSQQEELALAWQNRGRYDLALEVLNKK